MNRHTACTNMTKQGMNVKVLKYTMGHAHSDVTMDVYTHIANKQDIREEVERYARVLGLQNFVCKIYQNIGNLEGICEVLDKEELKNTDELLRHL
ncbi:MAG: tyrosine-type recombinase/integrase [Lachnospiraceae bacterium]|nr:tyrosine-type recombinase/integrase [Lachnospiraceae bacterium]